MQPIVLVAAVSIITLVIYTRPAEVPLASYRFAVILCIIIYSYIAIVVCMYMLQITFNIVIGYTMYV